MRQEEKMRPEPVMIKNRHLPRFRGACPKC
nr:MAG TPA: hypothetical protein [Caudoviricetes sp.]